MRTFTDAKGRSWNVSVTVASIKRVRAAIGLDLLDYGAVMNELQDPIAQADVLFALVKPDAEAQKVTDADFGESLTGEVMEQAGAALMEALLDFTPAQRKPALKKALGKLGEANLLAAVAMEQAMDEIDVTAEIEKALQTSGDTSTRSPESVA